MRPVSATRRRRAARERGTSSGVLRRPRLREPGCHRGARLPARAVRRHPADDGVALQRACGRLRRRRRRSLARAARRRPRGDAALIASASLDGVTRPVAAVLPWGRGQGTQRTQAVDRVRRAARARGGNRPLALRAARRQARRSLPAGASLHDALDPRRVVQVGQAGTMAVATLPGGAPLVDRHAREGGIALLCRAGRRPRDAGRARAVGERPRWAR